MAAHLRRHGLDCRIIDRAAAPSGLSRALVLWSRTLEMLDDLGTVESFLAAGMTVRAAHLHGRHGRLLADLPIDAAGTAYPRPLMLAQSETERLLTEHLGRAGVAVERAAELTEFADRGDHVTATLRRGDGSSEAVRCHWLLGCDGAHSTVRHGLGMDFAGAAEPNDWMLADCKVDGPVPHDALSLFWHARGVLAFFPFAADRCRVIADLGSARGAGHPADPSLAEVQAVVDERGPGGVRLSEPHWLAGFRINERKVADYRRGRVFLAGDAAHIHSPAGGQGMNTGMQDAWNLAWKLALVQAGAGRPSPLLDSYSQERSQVGAVVLRQAARMTWMATLRNPLGRFLRDRLVGVLGRLPAFRRGFVRYLSELAIAYPDSPLNGETNGRRWASDGARPGDRLPDVPLRDPATGGERRLLVTLHGPRHHLLLLPADGDPLALAALDDIRRRLDATYPDLIQSHLVVPGDRVPSGIGPPVVAWLDPSHSVRRLLGARGTAVALVRPDGYLGYRAQPALWEPLNVHVAQYLIPRSS
jgi:2-polyprenyl-6-methoxyphenol hydroxylase-like FAD-dependent oxidoreductase